MRYRNLIIYTVCVLYYFLNLESSIAQSKNTVIDEEIKSLNPEPIKEQLIPDLSLDGFGLSEDKGGLSGVSWDQKERKEFISFLTSIKVSSLPNVLKTKIIKLLSSRGTSSIKYSDNEIIAARLFALLSAGENQLVLKMLDSFPKALYKGFIWQTYFDALFMSNTIKEVCNRTGRMRKTLTAEPSLFIVKIVCLANRGEDTIKLIDDFVFKLATVNHTDTNISKTQLQRIQNLLQATKKDNKAFFVTKELRVTEFFLLYPNKNSWENISYEKTSAGVKKSILVQMNNEIELLPSSLVEGLVEDNLISISEYPRLVSQHPLLKKWGHLLLEARDNLLVAKRVDMVWQEKPYKESYARWLLSFANTYNEKKLTNIWKELPKVFYYISDTTKLEKIIKTILKSDDVNQDRASLLLELLNKEKGEIDIVSDLITEGLNGTLEWRDVLHSSIFKNKDNSSFMNWASQIFLSIQEKNYTFTYLLVASKISGEASIKWNNKELSEYTVAILVYSLVTLEMDDLAKRIVREYLVHKWIDSPI